MLGLKLNHISKSGPWSRQICHNSIAIMSCAKIVVIPPLTPFFSLIIVSYGNSFRWDFIIMYTLGEILFVEPCHIQEIHSRLHIKHNSLHDITPMQQIWSIRDHPVNVPGQWEMTLHSNIVSHWLGALTKWSLVHDEKIPLEHFICINK